MANLLYLVHRLPYPPNKGDKVRSFHLLKHLASRHRVFLGTFVDDPEDVQHIETLRPWCAEIFVARINPSVAKLLSLSGFFSRQALSVAFYRHAGMRDWVSETVKQNSPEATVIFSSQMAQFAPSGIPMIVDFVDVDSAKWAQYARARSWPLSWVYRREAQCLLAFERSAASIAKQSFFVTSKEVELFQSLAPECASTVSALKNGVDADFFSPVRGVPSPFRDGQLAIVFTGAMDYWPNIDGVTWFVQAMLAAVLAKWPQAHFYIVGRSPTAQVLALTSSRVTVTGTVADVRPYLQHAAAVVAPLRVARGIQNKILEAMAMARPVITVPSCAEVIEAQSTEGVISAATPEDFVREIGHVLANPQATQALGQAARECVLRQYSWHAHLSGIDTFLPAQTLGNSS